MQLVLLIYKVGCEIGLSDPKFQTQTRKLATCTDLKRIGWWSEKDLIVAADIRGGDIRGKSEKRFKSRCQILFGTEFKTIIFIESSVYNKV